MAADATEIDPLVEAIDLHNRHGISRELERNTPVLSRVLFLLEDVIEVEEIPKSSLNPNSPLPPNLSGILLYIGISTHRLSSPGLYQSIPSMATAGSMIYTVSATSVKTPLSIKGGGMISIPSIPPSTAIFCCTSIPYSSGGTQAFGSDTSSFPLECLPTQFLLFR